MPMIFVLKSDTCVYIWVYFPLSRQIIDFAVIIQNYNWKLDMLQWLFRFSYTIIINTRAPLIIISVENKQQVCECVTCWHIWPTSIFRKVTLDFTSNYSDVSSKNKYSNERQYIPFLWMKNLFITNIECVVQNLVRRTLYVWGTCPLCVCLQTPYRPHCYHV